MKHIRNIFKEIGYSISDLLRRICGGLSPDARLTVILVMLLLFTIGNLYFTISVIYDWGHRDGKKEMPEIHHIEGLDITGSDVENDTISRKGKRIMELIDSPIDLPELSDSINNKYFINNGKRTRKNGSC